MEPYLSQARIDELIAEDVPYLDLTTEVLGIGAECGRMEYFTREPGILCGTEAATRVMESLGARVMQSSPSGTKLEAGDAFFAVEGTASVLHRGWKVCLNLFDHLSAVATKTRAMVDAAHEANPLCEVLTTRKSMPGAKDLLVQAVMTGGAWPHRLGLSETVLVFSNHVLFMGGLDAFIAQLPQIRARCVEKKLFVEADVADALRLAQASAEGHGVDGIQLDKVSVDELANVVGHVRAIAPQITLIAAGGINPQNAAAYAATGVDGLATTAPFTAKPLDMSIRMHQ